MALSLHALVRVYGEVQSNPPFENAAGVAVLTATKPYPIAPLTYIPTNELKIWPLANGVLMGNTYVYSILELPPTGLNVHGLKYATDTSATVVASGAS